MHTHTQGSALTLWHCSNTSGLRSTCGRGWLRCSSSGCGSRSCTRLRGQLGDGVLEVLGLAHEGDGPGIVPCRLALIRLLHACLLQGGHAGQGLGDAGAPAETGGG